MSTKRHRRGDAIIDDRSGVEVTSLIYAATILGVLSFASFVVSTVILAEWGISYMLNPRGSIVQYDSIDVYPLITMV